MVEAGDVLGVVAPVLQLEVAGAISPFPALLSGLGVGRGAERDDVDECTSTSLGSGDLGDQSLPEA